MKPIVIHIFELAFVFFKTLSETVRHLPKLVSVSLGPTQIKYGRWLTIFGGPAAWHKRSCSTCVVGPTFRGFLIKRALRKGGGDEYVLS